MSSHPQRRAGASLFAAFLAAAAGCSESLSPEKTVATIEVAPRSARLYLPGQEAAFAALLTTAAGTDGAGIAVEWVTRNPALVEVSSTGTAKSVGKGGSTYIVATAGGKSDSALVEVPATPCGSATAVMLVPGQVATDVAASGFCSTASAGEYTVLVHNNSLASTGSGSFEINAIAVATPPATSGASLSLSATSGRVAPFAARRRDVATEMRDRRNAESAVAPFAAAASAYYASRSRRASLDFAVPAVGDLATYNVNTNGANGCTDVRTDIALRVAAVSNTAIVLADPRNPAGGFTDAEYAGYAAMFDSVISPLDVGAFGAPSDLDNNQRVLLVFTRAVNERTPAGVDYYIGGLTHPRDLNPRTSCAGSNEAEMFYLLVPDPTGTINGNKFDKGFVDQVTSATVAHEFQHLINFARRKLILPGKPLPSEELWLNEGLSHIAEELLYHRLSGQPTRANIGASVIYANEPTSFDVFAQYMGGDFLNYDEYAFRSPESSPFRAGDEVETRGATWSFLRYVADQKFSADGQFWFNLVNSGEVGLANLQNRLGVDASGLRGLLRDFTIAVYADDHVAGIAGKFTQPSWDMRSVYPGLQGYPDFDFPVTGTGLKENVTTTATLAAGGFKIYRFTGMGTADSYVRVTGTAGGPLPSSITMSVIRTK